MAGTRHRLFSAAVAARDGAPVWRAIGEAKLWMRPLSDTFIADYVAQNWDSIRWTVGCYEIEGAGVQLFENVEGDPWTIIRMPMLPLLAWLRATGLAAHYARPTLKPSALASHSRNRRGSTDSGSACTPPRPLSHPRQ